MAEPVLFVEAELADFELRSNWNVTVMFVATPPP